MFLQKGFPIIYQLLKLLSYLPLAVRETIISIFCWIRSFPQEFIPWIAMLIRPSVFSKLIYMSDDEMVKVKDADDALLKQNEHRLTFIYSTTDGWAPIQHFKRLVSLIPNAKAHITDKIEHSFVKESSCEMGAIVGKWIQQNAV